jgi:hypothetical protein
LVKKDIEYPAEIAVLYPQIVLKCKKIRRKLGQNQKDFTLKGCSIGEIMQFGNPSRTYKYINSKVLDNAIADPPSYFSRRKEGKVVPLLKDYMLGYRRIFALRLPAKTLEVAFLTLNRQIWTNQKAWWAGKEGNNTPECTLCGEEEDTEHLLFSCKEYSAEI